MIRPVVGVVAALATCLALLLTTPAAPAAGDGPAAAAGPKVAVFVPAESDNPRLLASWKRWVKARGTTYVTVVERACGECGSQPPAIRTKVRGNRLVSVHNDTNGKEVGFGWAWPMDRLYHLLRRGYARAEDVYVKYDKRGVPLTVAIDWSEMVADEETYLTVRARTSG